MNKQQFKNSEITVWPSKFTINQQSLVSENDKDAPIEKAPKEVPKPVQQETKVEKKSSEVKVTQFRPRGVMKPKLQL